MKKLLSLGIAAGILLGLVGCGGGGGGSTSKTPISTPTSTAASSSSAVTVSSASSVSSQSSSSQIATVQLSGTAAIGNPIIGGRVEAICADGSGFIAPVTTNAQGHYTAEVAEGTFPCLLQVSNGEPAVVLHSYAFASGNVNITPLTDLVSAMYFDALPADIFAALKANTCSGNCTLNNQQLTQAETQLIDALTAKGYLQGVDDFSPATTPFVIGDALDRVLDKLQEAINDSPDLNNYQALLQSVIAGGLDGLPVNEGGSASSSSSSSSISSSSVASSDSSSSAGQSVSSSVSSASTTSSSMSSVQSSSVASSASFIEPEMVAIPGTNYSMSKYETTFAEYDAFAIATERAIPSDADWGRGNRPVINVSWNDAVAYTEWLSQQTGKSYRLPTEDEWEFSARAGTTTEYSWGDDIGTNKANCLGCGDEWVALTAPVGSFQSNGFGLFDMHGNVWEWTSDCWVGECLLRVYRGGSWEDWPEYLRSAFRYFEGVSNSGPYIGFRLVQDLNNSTTQTPLLGAWVSTATCNWENWLCDSWLIFLSDKNYFSIQTTQPDEGCKVGVEMGTYTHHQTTGLFTPSPQFDSNDHCGISDANEETTLAIHTNGSQFLYKETASSEPIALVKPSLAKNYQGTWVINAGNHIEVLQLIEGTYVLGIYDNGFVDVEQGSYSYDAITGEFKITKSTQDQNLSKGFSGANSINFIFNASSLTITTDLNPNNPSVFSRLGTAASYFSTPSNPFITIGEYDGTTPINFASLCNNCASSTYSLSGDFAAWLTIDPDTGVAFITNGEEKVPGGSTRDVTGTVHYGAISIAVTIRVTNEG